MTRNRPPKFERDLANDMMTNLLNGDFRAAEAAARELQRIKTEAAKRWLEESRKQGEQK